MMAVWFGYSLFFQPTPPINLPPEQQSVSAQQALAPVSVLPEQDAAVQQVGVKTFSVSGQQVPVREITIENDLYRAIFSSSGARLISFELKNYRQESDPLSPFISLVDPSTFREATLSTSGMDGLGFPVDAVYQLDRPEDYLQLTGAQELRLVFSFVRQDGVSVEKTYIFHGVRSCLTFLS